MKITAGDLNNLISKSNTCLIVWDVQNMLVNNIFNKEEFTEKTKKVIEAVRRAGIAVFFTKITPLPERFESPARKMAFKSGFTNLDKNAFELYFAPIEGETVFNKHTASIFIGTPFELMTNNAGIKNILLTGIATEIGIESTAREALNRGYMPIIIKDCVSSSDKEAHERSLMNMDKLMPITEADEVIKVLDGLAR